MPAYKGENFCIFAGFLKGFIPLSIEDCRKKRKNRPVFAPGRPFYVKKSLSKPYQKSLSGGSAATACLRFICLLQDVLSALIGLAGLAEHTKKSAASAFCKQHKGVGDGFSCRLVKSLYRF